MTSVSPLRYPGGKQVIAPVLARLIRLNNCEGQVYAEPYAGGAGAALELLYSGYVKKLLLNDADPSIAAMWLSILNNTDKFVAEIERVPLSVAEWRRQRSIYLAADSSLSFELGFATFYLNRVNRSGIIKNAGPIGGVRQTGTWKIDARFNRKDLAFRVRRVAAHKRRISFAQEDALQFLQSAPPGCFVYLDPPYFVKGRELYLNHYVAADHKALALFLRGDHPFQWVMSYDDVPEIQTLYKGFRKVKFSLAYSARTARVGRELLICLNSLQLPLGWKQKLPPLRSVRA